MTDPSLPINLLGVYDNEGTPEEQQQLLDAELALYEEFPEYPPADAPDDSDTPIPPKS